MGPLEGGHGGTAGSSRRTAAIEALVYACAAFTLWFGTLGTPWISEDTSVVRHFASASGLADWWRPQYGMASLHFWRPLVSTTLDLQLAAHGPDPVPLRLFNMAAHLAGALLLSRLARALGAGALGSGLAGLLALLFPHQGGTVIWIVGRVDSLCWPLVVGAGLAAARGRGLLAGVLTLLALATKEMGVAALPLGLAAAWAAPDLDRSARRRAMVGVAAGFVAAVLWRSLAIGRFVGGYPGSDPLAAPFTTLVNGIGSLGPVAAMLPFGLVLAAAAGTLRGRVVLAGLIGCGGALLAITPLLRDGPPPAEHQRWLLVPDGLLCLAIAGLFAPRRKRELARLAPLAALVVLAVGAALWRADVARSDVRLWRAAGEEAAAFAGRLHTTLAQEPALAEPLLAVDVPRLASAGGAYTLHLGLADRFREPLWSGAAREVWPWRPLHGSVGPLAPAAQVRGGCWRPEEVEPGLTLNGPALVESVAGDTQGVRFTLASDAPIDGARVVLVTELGYDHALLPPPPADGWNMELLLAQNGATPLWQTLLFAADAGARRALFAIVAADGRWSHFFELRFDDATVDMLAAVL